MVRKFTRYGAVIGLAVLAFSCEPSSSPSANFDRGPLLENLGSELILPAYETLAEETQALMQVAQEFAMSPNLANLELLRTAWFEAYIAFQHTAYYNFGPADEYLLNTSLNTFPTSKSKVKANISDGSYNLQSVSNNDAKGFSSLDYLLFGLAEDDPTLLELYNSDAEADARKQYLIDVTMDINERVQQVFDSWSPLGGDYLGTFISRTGNDVGSSTGMLLNSAIQYLERDLRDSKIGIPLGIRSLNVAIPNNCEALYAHQSIRLASESVKTLQEIYLGKEAVGFDDYLAAINARYNGGTLDDIVQLQIETTLSAVLSIPEPYSDVVTDNPDPAMQAYQELQKLTILLKADVTSALGILITYQDNDGD